MALNFPSQTVKSSLSDKIRLQSPDWPHDGYIYIYRKSCVGLFQTCLASLGGANTSSVSASSETAAAHKTSSACTPHTVPTNSQEKGREGAVIMHHCVCLVISPSVLRTQQFKTFSIKYSLQPAAQSGRIAWHFYQELKWFQARWHSLQVKTIFSEILGMFWNNVLSLFLLMLPLMCSTDLSFFFLRGGKSIFSIGKWLSVRNLILTCKSWLLNQPLQFSTVYLSGFQHVLVHLLFHGKGISETLLCFRWWKQLPLPLLFS